MYKQQQTGGIVLPIIIVVVVVVLFAMFVPTGGRKPATDESQAVAERIQPVGMVEVKAVSGGGAARTGEEVFKAQCAACHASGALGAPKLGDAGAWGPRLGSGLEALVNSALKGKNAMPPQGGGDSSDYEIARAVVYMTGQAGGKFEEPKAPAAASAAQ